MPVVSSQISLLRNAYLYTTNGMVSRIDPGIVLRCLLLGELICDTSLRIRDDRNAAAWIFRFTHALSCALHVFVHVPLSTRRWLPNKPRAIVALEGSA